MLDRFLGRLLVPGEISVLHGDSRAILSVLAHHIAVAAAARPSTVIYLDSGLSFSPRLVRRIAPSDLQSDDLLSRMAIGRVLSLSDFEELVTRGCQRDDVALIVVDSLAGVLNLSTTPATRTRQRQLFDAISRVRSDVSSSAVHLLLLDHSVVDWSNRTLLPLGGLTLAHAVDTIVSAVRVSQSGGLVRLAVEKSSFGVSHEAVVIRVTSSGIFEIGIGE